MKNSLSIEKNSRLLLALVRKITSVMPSHLNLRSQLSIVLLPVAFDGNGHISVNRFMFSKMCSSSHPSMVCQKSIKAVVREKEIIIFMILLAIDTKKPNKKILATTFLLEKGQVTIRIYEHVEKKKTDLSANNQNFTHSLIDVATNQIDIQPTYHFQSIIVTTIPYSISGSTFDI